MKRVSELRKAKGWSQVKLAALSNVSLVTLQTIEAGRGNPTLDTIRKLAETLGVPAEELISEAVA